jgi:hypothetical protein
MVLVKSGWENLPSLAERSATKLLDLPIGLNAEQVFDFIKNDNNDLSEYCPYLYGTEIYSVSDDTIILSHTDNRETQYMLFQLRIG